MDARSRQCSKKVIAKNFFQKTLKFPKGRPITHIDDRDWVEKFLRTGLKFAESRPITSQKGKEGQQKKSKNISIRP
jgi:hypothetical protein